MQNYGNGAAYPAATTAGASMRMPHGVAPSAPVNGDFWTTAAGVFARIGGTTVGPLAPANLTVKAGAFTAVSNSMYNVQLTAAATVTLPSSPAAGDTVFLQDYSTTWNSYVLTVGSATANILPIGGGTAVASIVAAGAGNLTFTYNGSVWVTYYQSLAASAATASQIWTGTNNTAAVTPAGLLAAAAPVALTDAATITPDFNTGINFTLTLAGNRTLANPTNLKPGQSGVIVLTQDSTGSRTLAYGTSWKFAGGAPTLTTTAGAVDLISYLVVTSTLILCTLSQAFA